MESSDTFIDRPVPTAFVCLGLQLGLYLGHTGVHQAKLTYNFVGGLWKAHKGLNLLSRHCPTKT